MRIYYKHSYALCANIINKSAVENIATVIFLIMKMIAFWDIAPCILIEMDRPFRGAYCLHHQGNETRLHGGLSQKTVVSLLADMVS
jgi:hypothetical protein